MSDVLDPFTRNSIYLNLAKAMTIECNVIHIRQAIQRDLTLYETYHEFHQSLL
jgi:hypothetical protein